MVLKRETGCMYCPGATDTTEPLPSLHTKTLKRRKAINFDVHYLNVMLLSGHIQYNKYRKGAECLMHLVHRCGRYT